MGPSSVEGGAGSVGRRAARLRREADDGRRARSSPLPHGRGEPRGATLRTEAGTRGGERGGYARPVDPKTRNRIMAAVLVLMFVVVAVAAALG